MKNPAFAFLFVTLSWGSTVKAQYVGLDQTAVTQSQTPVMFENAVKAHNLELVKSMLSDGFKLDYDFNYLCEVSESGRPFQHPKTTLDKLLEFKHVSFSYSSAVVLFPTACSMVPVFTNMDNVEWHHLTENTVLLGGKQNAGKADKALEQIEFFSDLIKPHHYEQYLPIIVNHNLPFRLRKLALDRYLSAIKDIESYPKNARYESLKRETVRRYKEMKAVTSSSSDRHAGYIAEPVQVLFIRLVQQYQEISHKHSSNYGRNYSYKGKKSMPDIATSQPDLPVFSVRQIEAGGMTAQDYLTLQKSRDAQVLKTRAIQMDSTLKLIRVLLDTGLIDLNHQTPSGDTILHLMVSGRDAGPGLPYPLANLFNPSLIRYFLEKGANPMLLNQKGESAFAEHERIRAMSTPTDNGQRISDAFILKEFVDQ